MLKFGRNYRLKFKIGRRTALGDGKYNVDWLEEVNIQYPLTVQFSVTRSNFSYLNSCTLQIHNLNENTRGKLYKDRFDSSKYIVVEFYAGYGQDSSALPQLYAGEVYECYSWKQGAGTEFFTEISCLTGVSGAQYSRTNITFEKETKPIDIIKRLCSDIGYPLAYCSDEILSAIPNLKRKQSFTGNSLDLLKEFVGIIDGKGKRVIIDNNVIMILGENDVVGEQVLILSDSAGLLGYPKRRESYIDVEMVFEPLLQQCGYVQLLSSIDNYFNGVWKVVAFVHSGVIGGGSAGQCVTKVSLFTGSKSFNNIKELAV